MAIISHLLLLSICSGTNGLYSGMNADTEKNLNMQKNRHNVMPVLLLFFYTIPCAIIASATLRKPAMFAPTTKLSSCPYSFAAFAML